MYLCVWFLKKLCVSPSKNQNLSLNSCSIEQSKMIVFNSINARNHLCFVWTLSCRSSSMDKASSKSSPVSVMRPACQINRNYDFFPTYSKNTKCAIPTCYFNVSGMWLVRCWAQTAPFLKTLKVVLIAVLSNVRH